MLTDVNEDHGRKRESGRDGDCYVSKQEKNKQEPSSGLREGKHRRQPRKPYHVTTRATRQPQ